MKISEQEITRLLAVSPHDRYSSTNSELSSGRGDVANRPAARIDLSTAAQEIQQVKKVIARLPDVREDRVQALKAQIESGTYHVSGEDIADLIIRRALADNTLL